MHHRECIIANASLGRKVSFEDQGSPMRNAVSMHEGPEFSPRARIVFVLVLLALTNSHMQLLCQGSQSASLSVRFKKGDPLTCPAALSGKFHRCNIRRISSVRQFFKQRHWSSHIKPLSFFANFLLIKIKYKL